MHLSSVLVGIVIGLALGGLVGWSARGRRRVSRTEEPPHPYPAVAAHPAALSPRTALLFAGPPADRPVLTMAASTPSAASAPRPAEPEADGDQALMEALRAASRRLNDEAQTRLSRESPDVPREDPAAVAASLPRSSGQHLLELSRRLTEDTARRLARDGEPGAG